MLCYILELNHALAPPRAMACPASVASHLNSCIHNVIRQQSPLRSPCPGQIALREIK